MPEDNADRFDRIETALTDLRTRIETAIDEDRRAQLRADLDTTVDTLEKRVGRLRERSQDEFAALFDDGADPSEDVREEFEARLDELETQLADLQATVDDEVDETVAEATEETKSRLREALKRAEDGIARLRGRLQ